MHIKDKWKRMQENMMITVAAFDRPWHNLQPFRFRWIRDQFLPRHPPSQYSIRGIEVGHIFQLGKVYAEDMKANVLNSEGKASTLYMGCYGIGVSRLVAAAIEQNFDEKLTGNLKLNLQV
mgnify:CR=1 FL=1